MGTNIMWESSTLLASLFWGMLLALEYDCIRVFRRVVRHRRIWTMAMQDIIYWINVGITVFCVIYELSDGVIRGFSVAGMLAGAILFRYGIGRYFVKYVSKAIIFALKPLKKVASLVIMVINKMRTARKKDNSNEV